MKKVLIQLDTDPHPSTFDRVVAVDAGTDDVFSYGGITPDIVTALVHGAMFTRGGNELKNTALFVGGSDVELGERLMQKIGATFFGPVRVSVMMDSNGSNTTAAAAVLLASRHLSLDGTRALVLGGTGPVGHRAAQLIAGQGGQVHVASRSLERATSTCEAIRKATGDRGQAVPLQAESEESLVAAAKAGGIELIISAGAAGVRLLSASSLRSLSGVRVAIDLNAVPPAGLESIEVMDKAKDRDGVTCYGAIGVGGTKMKIHKAALRQLFETNDLVLDTQAIYRLATETV